MNKVESIEKEYKEKQPIFEKIFMLECKEIRKIVGKILKDHNIDFNIDTANIKKESINDKPNEIIIEFYDYITISFIGIYFHPEHGEVKLITKLYNDFVKE